MEIADALEKQMIEATPALQVFRKCLGQEIDLRVCDPYQKTIPAALRGTPSDPQIDVSDLAQGNIPAGVMDFWPAPKELIALELGTGDLAVVGCQSLEALNRFREANAGLERCLVSTWKQMFLLWLRTDGPLNNAVLPEGWIWLRRGAIPICWPALSLLPSLSTLITTARPFSNGLLLHASRFLTRSRSCSNPIESHASPADRNSRRPADGNAQPHPARTSDWSPSWPGGSLKDLHRIPKGYHRCRGGISAHNVKRYWIRQQSSSPKTSGKDIL